MSSKQIRSGAKAPGHRRHIVGRLMGYIKRGYKARFIIVLVCILVSAIANVAGSLFLGSLIDDYITPLLGAADPDFSGLVRALVMMGCLFLVGALCAYAYNRNMIVVSQGVQKTIRDDLFGHMQTLPIKYFDTHAHGDVMSVYTNDVDTLRQMFAQSIPQVINSSMTILVTFLGMLFTNALLTVVVLVCVCFALVVTRFLAGRSGRYFLRQQSTLGALNGYIEEMINGQKVVKVFCHEQEAQDGFDRVNDEMFHSADKAHTYASILMPIMVNIGNVQYVIVAMVGGALALSGVDTTITLGVIASFLQLSKSFSNPINQISQQFNSIIMALAGAERIFALMDEEPEEDHGTVTLVNVSYDKEGHQLEESEKRTNLWAWRVPHSTDMVMVPVREEADGSFTELKAPEAGKDEAWAWKYQEHGKAFYRPILGPVRNVESEDYYLIKLSGDVRFDHVDFAYEEGKTILHDISLFAKPGQKLAFVGATGAGKTTMMKAELGLIPTAHGSIRVLGQPAGSANSRIGYVPQSYASDIESNITAEQSVLLGLTGTKFGIHPVTKALRDKARKAMDFVGLQDKANYSLSELSGGLRQRVAIAQALVDDPKLLMLDEPLANLDLASQRATVHVLAKLNRELGMTIQVVAHDLNMLLPILTGAVYLLDGHPHYAGMNEVLDSHLLTHLYGTTVQVVTTPQGDMFVTPSEDEPENMSIDAHASGEIAQFHHHSHTTQED